MTPFAEWSLALSHACSGASGVISGIVAFSIAFADQSEGDYAALKSAIRDGRVKAVVEKGIEKAK